jgi:Uma2 family endonuclease
MTYEEYLDWVDDHAHSEWVDGEVFVFMAPKPPHARSAFLLAQLLSLFAQDRDLGEVLVAPVEMLIRRGRSSREPDVLFLAREHLDRITAVRIEGGADLVIEFVSDDSVTRDYVDKFQEYAEEGIPEYWIADARPGQQQTRFYQLTAEGTYQEVPLDHEERYHSAAVRGFWFKPEWLWQDPLPKVMPLVETILGDAGTDIGETERS